VAWRWNGSCPDRLKYHGKIHSVTNRSGSVATATTTATTATFAFGNERNSPCTTRYNRINSHEALSLSLSLSCSLGNIHNPRYGIHEDSVPPKNLFFRAVRTRRATSERCVAHTIIMNCSLGGKAQDQPAGRSTFSAVRRDAFPPPYSLFIFYFVVLHFGLFIAIDRPSSPSAFLAISTDRCMFFNAWRGAEVAEFRSESLGGC
jgi:hypothetical protein